jgi:hypothetical protein
MAELVARLLERYALIVDEIKFRERRCVQVGVQIGDRRLVEWVRASLWRLLAQDPETERAAPRCGVYSHEARNERVGLGLWGVESTRALMSRAAKWGVCGVCSLLRVPQDRSTWSLLARGRVGRCTFGLPARERTGQQTPVAAENQPVRCQSAGPRAQCGVESRCGLTGRVVIAAAALAS